MSWLREAKAKLRSPPTWNEISAGMAAKAKPEGEIVFLDVDGVLNTRASRTDANEITAELVANFAWLCSCLSQQRTIVLSTTWRLKPGDKQLLTLTLQKAGIAVHSSTPDLSTTGGDRVDEIFAWLEEHDGLSQPWVAIDDLDLLRANPRLDAHHFVRTHDANGLTRACAEQAVLQLRRQRDGARASALETATTLSAEEEAELAPYHTAISEIVARECTTHDEPELPVECVLPSLLLSDKDGARDAETLARLKVTHVLNACAPDRVGADAAAAAAFYQRLNIAYLEIEAQDSLTYDMTQHVEAGCRFLSAAADSGGVGLVHCQAGINRSGFLAVVHTMRRGQLPLLTALDRCKEVRGVILLNRAFQLQLLRYAAANGHLGAPPIPPSTMDRVSRQS